MRVCFENRIKTNAFIGVNLGNSSNGASRVLIISENGVVELEYDRYNQRAED